MRQELNATIHSSAIFASDHLEQLRPMDHTRSPFRVETIDIDGTTIPYRVRRSPRARHIRITISPYDGVVVTLPLQQQYYVSPARFLREKGEWVLRQYMRVAPPPPRPPLGNGSMIPILGRTRLLRVGLGRGTEPRFALIGGQIHALIPRPSRRLLRDSLRGWLMERACSAIERVARREADRIGVSFRRITVRDQKTKWGSCSRTGCLSFNWRLVLFPPAVMRYIVIHELCHLRHFNHSPRFWSLVARHDPRYQESIDWLKRQGHHADAIFR